MTVIEIPDEQAAALKATLIEDGMWWQYLEVAIVPDAEVFTESTVLYTTVGGGVNCVGSVPSWTNL